MLSGNSIIENYHQFDLFLNQNDDYFCKHEIHVMNTVHVFLQRIRKNIYFVFTEAVKRGSIETDLSVNAPINE